MKFHLFILSFLSLAVGDILVKILLHEISEIFLPIFSSRTFMGSWVIFKSFIHFYSIFYCLWYYSCPNFFSPFFLSSLQRTPPSYIPPYFMSMGCTCKFFGLSISYAILNLSLCILCLSIMLFIPCTFPPTLPLTLPTDTWDCDLHFCNSIPVLVVCLVFVFRFSW